MKTTPDPPADLDERARELLAAEFAAAGLDNIAKNIREFGDSQGWATSPDGVITRALAAIRRALTLVEMKGTLS